MPPKKDTKSNESRKCTNFHLTWKGHLMLPMPESDGLFYCYETGDLNGTKHTHCGFRARVAISKRELLSYVQQLDGAPPNIDIAVHNRWETIIGYHYGKGGKPACTGIKWVVGEPDRRDIFFARRHATAEKNKILLATNEREAVDTGLISLLDVRKLRDAKLAYRSFTTKMVIEPGTRFTLPWEPKLEWKFAIGKLRHLWLFSKHSNAGKTTFSNMLREQHRCALYHPAGWWHCEDGFQFVLFDAFRPWREDGDRITWTFDWRELEALCDGGYMFNQKYAPLYVSDQHYVVVITSNLSPREAYGEDKEKYLKTRFIVYEIDIEGTLLDFYD